MYDAFISYSHDDKDWVVEIVNQLRRRQRANSHERLRVFLDLDSIQVGENWVATIEKALQNSHYIIPIFSDSYFKSKSSGWELLQKLISDLDAKGQTILPCLISQCDIPPRVRHIQYIDFSNACDRTSKIYKHHFELLVSAIKGNKSNKQKNFPRLIQHEKSILPDFPYFIYISDSKLEMLEGLVAPPPYGKSYPKVSKGKRRFKAIKSVISELQRSEQIGDIQSNKPYISGNLLLKWGIIDWGVCDADVRISFFMTCKTNPILLLTGSAHHILGSTPSNYKFPPGIFGFSGSHLPGIMRSIRFAYDGQWSQNIGDPYDWAFIVQICCDKFQEQRRGLNKDLSFNFPSQQLNFVARVLRRIPRPKNKFLEDEYPDSDVLIATPIYVALSD